MSRNRIVFNSTVHHGKSVLRGARLPVSVILGSIAGGMSFGDIEHEYDVTAADIRAALKFGAELEPNFLPPRPPHR